MDHPKKTLLRPGVFHVSQQTPIFRKTLMESIKPRFWNVNVCDGFELFLTRLHQDFVVLSVLTQTPFIWPKRIRKVTFPLIFDLLV